jgi:hypothetical protein
MAEKKKHGVEHNYGKVDRDYGLRMFTMKPEDDGPVFMVNYMKYKETADYGEGENPGISGREADDKYAPVDVLGRIGAYVAFHGDIVDQSGSTTPLWDRIGVVCYPTRRAFIEMQNRPDFQEKHVHKNAGMDQTFVIGSLPREGTEPGDYRTVKDSRGVVQVSAHKGINGVTAADVVDALAASRVHAAANGCDRGQWYDVEGTIMGDGRTFDVICFDAFPGVDAYRAYRAALAADPACALLVDPARTDGYSVAVDAAIDRITMR